MITLTSTECAWLLRFASRELCKEASDDKRKIINKRIAELSAEHKKALRREAPLSTLARDMGLAG